MSFLFGNNKTNDELKYYMEQLEATQPLVSKIEEIRHDHKNGLTTIGEALDNSISWGSATEIIIDLTDTRLKIIDNGVGVSSIKRMSEILLLGNKNQTLKEDPGKKNVMGKFGLGLPKGSIIIGNKVTVISKTEGKIMTTIADWQDMIDRNTYKPSTRESTPEEIEDYMSYLSQMNGAETGTLVKYENFNSYVKFNTKQIYDYLICLYQKDNLNLEKITIKEKGNTVDFGEGYSNPIVNFGDVTYYKKTQSRWRYHGFLYKYNDGKNNFYTTFGEGPLTYSQLRNANFKDEKLIYKMDVYITAIDDNFVKKSHYVAKKNIDLIGIKIYRNNRDITQLGAQKWEVIDPSTKMYRDVGLRIRMDFNGDIEQCSHFDEDFKVSSLKCVDEPSYYHYEDSLKTVLKIIGNEAEILHEKRKKSEKCEAEDKIKLRFDNIRNKSNQFTEEQIESEREFLTNFRDTGNYYIDPENSDIPPFVFDGRNGLFRKFKETMYQELIKILDNRFVEEDANDENSTDEDIVDDMESDNQVIVDEGESDIDDGESDNEGIVDNGESDNEGIVDSRESDVDSGGTLVELNRLNIHNDNDTEVVNIDTMVHKIFCNQIYEYENIRTKFAEEDKILLLEIYQKLFE